MAKEARRDMGPHDEYRREWSRLMSDFLLELRCEEIPARMQAGARAELEKLFRARDGRSRRRRRARSPSGPRRAASR